MKLKLRLIPSFSGIHDLNKEPVDRSNLPQSVRGKKKKKIQSVAAVDI